MITPEPTFHNAPLDGALGSALAAQSLSAARVDGATRAASDAWLEAVARGFLGGEPNATRQEVFFAGGSARRTLGVYDAGAPVPEVPVATFASWEGELTLPGGMVPTCAISAVTVAPSHRRRGILRTLMAGELRTAVARGIPVASLTVSESTIYGRFGFGPAAPSAHWEIKTRRARWIGPESPGRLDFVTRAQGRALAEKLHERVRPDSPGELAMPAGHWDRTFGTRADAEKPELLRVIQYRSPAGEVDGLALYKVAENSDDFAESSLEVVMLLAATDEAYAGLWRFLLSMDLIATVRADLLGVDEPLWWMIADQRAVKITITDHHYVRILDVPAALGARRYDIADSVAFEVTDPLEIAGGTYVLTTDAGGAGSVDAVDDAPLGLPVVRLGVAELSSLLLGGVSATTLARAGRIETEDPERFTRLFQTPRAPRLSYWY